MIAAIKEWIIGIVVTIIFMSIVDLVLPDNSFKKYAKIATGLIVIIAILSPVFKLFKGGISIERYIEGYTASLSLDKGVDTSQVDAMVDKETIRLFKENLKEKIEGDILSQLKKTCQVTALKIDEDTSSKSFGKVLYLEIKSDVSKVENIKPVERIVIGGEQPAAAAEAEGQRDKEILQLLSDRYEVESSVVKFIK
jgi:stage III sporulation protein AF